LPTNNLKTKLITAALVTRAIVRIIGAPPWIAKCRGSMNLDNSDNRQNDRPAQLLHRRSGSPLLVFLHCTASDWITAAAAI